LSAAALAFVTYALVPYLGILFCPGAVLLGGVGLLRSRRTPHARRDSALSVVLGLAIFCAQLLLWWILYKVPEWSRRAPF
jgi:predicted small integral membrane protein